MVASIDEENRYWKVTMALDQTWWDAALQNSVWYKSSDELLNEFHYNGVNSCYGCKKMLPFMIYRVFKKTDIISQANNLTNPQTNDLKFEQHMKE